MACVKSSEPQAPPRFSRFHLPGLNLPLNWTPHKGYTKHDHRKGGVCKDFPAQGEGEDLFLTALNDADNSSLRLITLREIAMLSFMNYVTDKEGWEEKVFDEMIANKWTIEMLAGHGQGFSRKMVDWCIEELRYKAKIFNDTGAICVFNGDVVKSDIAILETTKEALQAAARSLVDIPEVYKDYHPGSNGLVLDLVHPSLFPLIYGRTRVLDDSLIGLDDCTKNCGKGVVVPIRSDTETFVDRGAGFRVVDSIVRPYGKNFQWLPCDIDISKDDGRASIVSYINNLHPQNHELLYAIIEEVITCSIPLWNMTLTALKAPDSDYERIKFDELKYDPDPDAMSDSEWPQKEEGEDEDAYSERKWEWERNIRKAVQPEPAAFHPPTITNEVTVDLVRDYSHRGLQVIVKLADIELTPEKPNYEGGTWHVEGQLNEHICATALYYYDNENISSSRLAFRQQSSIDGIDEMNYPQDEHQWLWEVFGCRNNTAAVQEIGSVSCKEGRLITFPNILQHKVGPFRLADPTKKGHRKILALFLVDPGIRVISTANVPPQQRGWWSEEVIKSFAKSGEAFDKLSNELKDKVFESVDDFPISMEDAMKLRLELMEERKSYVTEQSKHFEIEEFNLCEH